jgi:hypothetical protein
MYFYKITMYLETKPKLSRYVSYFQKSKSYEVKQQGI